MITINKPIWNGGKRYIGIADYRVRESGYMVHFECDYKNKAGERIYPKPFAVPKWLVMRQKTYVLKPSGTTVYLIPDTIFNDYKPTKTEIAVKDAAPIVEKNHRYCSQCGMELTEHSVCCCNDEAE